MALAESYLKPSLPLTKNPTQLLQEKLSHDSNQNLLPSNLFIYEYPLYIFAPTNP